MNDITALAQRNQQLKAFITGFLSDPEHDEQSANSMTAEVFRIALTALESRTVTVKLPAEKSCPAEYAGSQLWSETEVWNKAITACAEGNAYMDEFCVSNDRGLLEDEVAALNDTHDTTSYRVVALYTALPLTDSERAELQEHRKAETESMAASELLTRAKQLMYQSGGAPIENSLNPIDAFLFDAERAEPQVQRKPETADREMLHRLAVIMSGSDTPGEIRSLTVTAQSLVDRCKQLALEKEMLLSSPQIVWQPASPEELSKRSLRESDIQPSREEIRDVGETISCPRCGGESYKLARRGWIHCWCDTCATGAGDDGRALYSNGAGTKDAQI